MFFKFLVIPSVFCICELQIAHWNNLKPSIAKSSPLAASLKSFNYTNFNHTFCWFSWTQKRSKKIPPALLSNSWFRASPPQFQRTVQFLSVYIIGSKCILSSRHWSCPTITRPEIFVASLFEQCLINHRHYRPLFVARPKLHCALHSDFLLDESNIRAVNSVRILDQLDSYCLFFILLTQWITKSITHPLT